MSHLEVEPQTLAGVLAVGYKQRNVEGENHPNRGDDRFRHPSTNQ